jgi:hypothetical protein
VKISFRAALTCLKKTHIDFQRAIVLLELDNNFKRLECAMIDHLKLLEISLANPIVQNN